MKWVIYRYECRNPVGSIDAPDYATAEHKAFAKWGRYVMVLDAATDRKRRTAEGVAMKIAAATGKR